MLLQEVDPFLRCAVRFRYARVHSVRCPADARILYVMAGEGKLFLEGTEHLLCAGTLALIGPGVVYRMELDSPLELIALNFDYTWQRQNLEETLEALPPEAAEQVPKVSVEDCPALSAPMILQNAQSFQAALEQIFQTFQQRKCYFREESACLLKALLIRLARTALLTDTTGDAVADGAVKAQVTLDQADAAPTYEWALDGAVLAGFTGDTCHIPVSAGGKKLTVSVKSAAYSGSDGRGTFLRNKNDYGWSL